MYVESVVRRQANAAPLIPRVTAMTTVRVDHTQVELAEDRGHRLRMAAREYGTSIEVMVQAAWLILLDGLTGAGELDETMPIRSLLPVKASTGVSVSPMAVTRVQNCA